METSIPQDKEREQKALPPSSSCCVSSIPQVKGKADIKSTSVGRLPQRHQSQLTPLPSGTKESYKRDLAKLKNECDSFAREVERHVKEDDRDRHQLQLALRAARAETRIALQKASRYRQEVLVLNLLMDHQISELETGLGDSSLSVAALPGGPSDTVGRRGRAGKGGEEETEFPLQTLVGSLEDSLRGEGTEELWGVDGRLKRAEREETRARKEKGRVEKESSEERGEARETEREAQGQSLANSVNKLQKLKRLWNETSESRLKSLQHQLTFFQEISRVQDAHIAASRRLSERGSCGCACQEGCVRVGTIEEDRGKATEETQLGRQNLVQETSLPSHGKQRATNAAVDVFPLTSSPVKLVPPSSSSCSDPPQDWKGKRPTRPTAESQEPQFDHAAESDAEKENQGAIPFPFRKAQGPPGGPFPSPFEERRDAVAQGQGNGPPRHPASPYSRKKSGGKLSGGPACGAACTGPDADAAMPAPVPPLSVLDLPPRSSLQSVSVSQSFGGLERELRDLCAGSVALSSSFSAAAVVMEAAEGHERERDRKGGQRESLIGDPRSAAVRGGETDREEDRDRRSPRTAGRGPQGGGVVCSSNSVSNSAAFVAQAAWASLAWALAELRLFHLKEKEKKGEPEGGPSSEDIHMIHMIRGESFKEENTEPDGVAMSHLEPAPSSLQQQQHPLFEQAVLEDLASAALSLMEPGRKRVEEPEGGCVALDRIAKSSEQLQSIFSRVLRGAEGGNRCTAAPLGPFAAASVPVQSVKLVESSAQTSTQRLHDGSTQTPTETTYRSVFIQTDREREVHPSCAKLQERSSQTFPMNEEKKKKENERAVDGCTQTTPNTYQEASTQTHTAPLTQSTHPSVPTQTDPDPHFSSVLVAPAVSATTPNHPPVTASRQSEANSHTVSAPLLSTAETETKTGSTAETVAVTMRRSEWRALLSAFETEALRSAETRRDIAAALLMLRRLPFAFLDPEDGGGDGDSRDSPNFNASEAEKGNRERRETGEKDTPTNAAVEKQGRKEGKEEMCFVRSPKSTTGGNSEEQENPETVQGVCPCPSTAPTSAQTPNRPEHRPMITSSTQERERERGGERLEGQRPSTPSAGHCQSLPPRTPSLAGSKEKENNVCPSTHSSAPLTRQTAPPNTSSSVSATVPSSVCNTFRQTQTPQPPCDQIKENMSGSQNKEAQNSGVSQLSPLKQQTRREKEIEEDTKQQQEQRKREAENGPALPLSTFQSPQQKMIFQTSVRTLRLNETFNQSASSLAGSSSSTSVLSRGNRLAGGLTNEGKGWRGNEAAICQKITSEREQDSEIHSREPVSGFSPSPSPSRWRVSSSDQILRPSVVALSGSGTGVSVSVSACTGTDAGECECEAAGREDELSLSPPMLPAEFQIHLHGINPEAVTQSQHLKSIEEVLERPESKGRAQIHSRPSSREAEEGGRLGEGERKRGGRRGRTQRQPFNPHPHPLTSEHNPDPDSESESALCLLQAEEEEESDPLDSLDRRLFSSLGVGGGSVGRPPWSLSMWQADHDQTDRPGQHVSPSPSPIQRPKSLRLSPLAAPDGQNSRGGSLSRRLRLSEGEGSSLHSASSWTPGGALSSPLRGETAPGLSRQQRTFRPGERGREATEEQLGGTQPIPERGGKVLGGCLEGVPWQLGERGGDLQTNTPPSGQEDGSESMMRGGRRECGAERKEGGGEMTSESVTSSDFASHRGGTVSAHPDPHRLLSAFAPGPFGRISSCADRTVEGRIVTG
uniref:Uncharacterized protein n=1 Tax=Chromera velia CCMP2878 TaxID=1169474 RepID=A0A0G4IB32_9ALVE|eukprot:Cvel_12763.t1-p1 / transcript=Cvel_12763.t1 / gene=Cvel_12763 / organism=Chromera_velia_CCMP2878 / gene_product=hypothetical protein / transcript_product=hypothetical protein / location=Cvel_scaffold849:8486-17920(-) / protein_length=1743 / sequence_SO=supercontig / SO=protein_coding / is_pseudo=false